MDIKKDIPILNYKYNNYIFVNFKNYYKNGILWQKNSISPSYLFIYIVNAFEKYRVEYINNIYNFELVDTIIPTERLVEYNFLVNKHNIAVKNKNKGNIN